MSESESAAAADGQTAIIGAGVMGEALLSGLVRAGRRVDNLLVGEKRPERAAELEERYGVSVLSNVEAARKADTVALVVKPQDMAAVLEEIAPVLRAGQLLASLAAGITTGFIESRVPAGVAAGTESSRRGGRLRRGRRLTSVPRPSERSRPLGGGLHRGEQRGPHAVLLQDRETRGRRAPG